MRKTTELRATPPSEALRDYIVSHSRIPRIASSWLTAIGFDIPTFTMSVEASRLKTYICYSI